MSDLQGRRRVLKAGLAGLTATIPAWAGLTACAGMRLAGDEPLLGFRAVPVSTADGIAVPAGYKAQVLYRWGDAVGVAGAMPEFHMDGSNSAAEQALQAGMHHDHIEFFPLTSGGGLLAVNHEYTDDGLLHADGMRTWSAEKVRKSQAAHGVAIVEVAQAGNEWRLVRPSRYARRITAYTPMSFSGPAAGHELLRTMADPAGREPLGTLNNCAGGITPWGTYLTCEENFNMYFANRGAIPAEQRRCGIGASSGYRWHELDLRFDAQLHPHEPNRFGWVVEIDPYDRHSRPVKRTALGRFKHEAALVTLAEDGRVVVYMGDDERFEYVYKFVSRRRFDPKDRASNRALLDDGTLYVARFHDSGHGEWIALPSRPEALIRTRQAADAAGATKMDRPEWVAVHPKTGDVYLALTNNDRRGADGQPKVDACNPRAQNVYGHIMKWREQGGDAGATKLRWEMFALCGEEKGFGSPDGLAFDQRGVLWIQTDVSTSALNRGPYAKIGNNQMLAADVATGEIRRFLTGPAGCEITGVAMAPDGRTMFVNVQHPGEPASERTNPDAPRAVSNWPDFLPHSRPRSATIAIRREDGGLVGT
ncbi:MAG: PhoX family protein [Betaproteobacteria bacterium]